MMWTVNPVMKPKTKIILFKHVVLLHEPSSWEKNRQLQIMLKIQRLMSSFIIISTRTYCEHPPSPCSTTCMSFGSCPSINAVTKTLVFNVVESWNVYCCKKFFWVLPSIDFCFDWWPHIQSLFHVFYNDVHLTVIEKIGTVNPVKSWLEQKFICEDVLVLHEPTSCCHWEKNRQLQIILKIQR